MNYALIFAGGVGQRMNNGGTPKQFLEVSEKPILVHTLEHFEHHPDIDGICLVCVEEWLEYAKTLLKKFQLKKVRWLIAGGATALESQYKGLKTVSADCLPEDVVLIHDGVRPLINEQLISDCISTVKQFGAAVTVAPAIETIIKTDENGMVNQTIARSTCMLARAPQAFCLGDILGLHDKAKHENNYDFIDSVSMMLHYGRTIKTVQGPAENIKVTTPADFYVCRALLDSKGRT